MKIDIRSAAGLLLISFLWLSNSTGVLPEHTGAPGEMTCGRASCHNAPVNAGSALAGIDVGGGSNTYRAGDTLALTVSISGAQSPRNGFQITALDAANNFAGAWILTSPDEMQIVNGLSLPRKYVTHQAAGNLQSSWAMDWVAPDADAGDITFYAAILDGNDDGTVNRDSVYAVATTLVFDPANAAQDIWADQDLQVYPNPAVEELFVNSPGGPLRSIRLVNMRGEALRQWQPVSGANRLNVAGLADGAYFLLVESGRGKEVKKVVLKR